MDNYTYVVGASFVNLTNIKTGNSQTITKDDARYNTVVEFIKVKKFEECEKFLDIKIQVNSFASGTNGSDFVVSLENGNVFYSYKGGAKTVLHNALVDRIIAMAQEGFDVGPMVRFMSNLLCNPIASAVEEAYLFLEACKLPITDDGCFIAYKIVQEDYMDIYSRTMSNKIGAVLEMPRFEVDSNRNNTCSRGLHFCSKEYLNAYGSSSRSTDRAMLVKINPADIVSIPSDYNNAKGRAWRYEVVGEVPSGWRQTLPHADHFTAPIVTAKCTPYTAVAPDEEVNSLPDAWYAYEDSNFYFDDYSGCFRWEDTDNKADLTTIYKRFANAGIYKEEADAFFDEMDWDVAPKKATTSNYRFDEFANRWYDQAKKIYVSRYTVASALGLNVDAVLDME